jgi:hypothetical protein
MSSTKIRDDSCLCLRAKVEGNLPFLQPLQQLLLLHPYFVLEGITDRLSIEMDADHVTFHAGNGMASSFSLIAFLGVDLVDPTSL